MDSGHKQAHRICLGPKRDKGAILLLALLFLLLLGILSSTVVQTGTLQMKMALNEQLQVEAMQDARALARAMTLIPSNFSLDQPVGSVRCPQPSPETGCDFGGLQLPSYQVVSKAAKIDFRLVRRGPEFIDTSSPPFTQVGEIGSPELLTALFEIQVKVDGSAVGIGSAEAIRGVVLQLPDFTGIDSAAADDLSLTKLLHITGVYWRYPRFDPL